MMASAAFEGAGAARAAAASKAVMLVAASRAVVCLSRSPDIELPGPRVAQAAFRAELGAPVI
jgi:hypothetical protein